MTRISSLKDQFQPIQNKTWQARVWLQHCECHSQINLWDCREDSTTHSMATQQEWMLSYPCQCRLESIRLSPSSCMAVTGCHYTDFISSRQWMYISVIIYSKVCSWWYETQTSWGLRCIGNLKNQSYPHSSCATSWWAKASFALACTCVSKQLRLMHR